MILFHIELRQAELFQIIQQFKPEVQVQILLYQTSPAIYIFEDLSIRNSYCFLLFVHGLSWYTGLGSKLSYCCHEVVYGLSWCDFIYIFCFLLNILGFCFFRFVLVLSCCNLINFPCLLCLLSNIFSYQFKVLFFNLFLFIFL